MHRTDAPLAQRQIANVEPDSRMEDESGPAAEERILAAQYGPPLAGDRSRSSDITPGE
jgi:hypothetical protein